jgi:Ca-activated chloride channel family protein
MSFAAPAWLGALALVPILLWAYLAARANARRHVVRFAATSTLALAAAEESRVRRHLPAALMLAACAALVLALARPHRTTRVAAGRGSVVLVLDHSGSMQATDVRPTRLAAAEHAARAFLAELPAAVRAGAIAFSTTPDAVRAPTTDRGAVQQIIASQGAFGATATGSALQLALDLLGHGGAIVLLSDGAANAGRNPLAVAAEAGARRIPIYTIALGSANATIPDPSGTGEPISVPPDPQLLARIAQAAHGQAFSAEDSGRLIAIYRRLGQRLGSVARRHDLTIAFALAGGVLLLAASGLGLSRGGGLP